MLRAVLFDFNGIILDDEPLHLELFQRVATEEGLELSREVYYADYLGFDDRGCFTALLRRAGREVSEPQLMRLVVRKASYYREAIQQRGYPFFPGAIELVRRCSSAGLHVGVVSGALREEIEGALGAASIAGAIKVVVAAGDVRLGKPDPEGYANGIALLNSVPPCPDRLLHPHEVAAIEDSPAGLQAARAAGCLTVGVAHTYSADRLTEADLVVDRLLGLDLASLSEHFAGGAALS